jgi:hypothetical protein
LELAAKITGEMSAPTVTVNITTSPEFLAFQNRVLVILAKFPDALAAMRMEFAPPQLTIEAEG